MQIQVQMKYEYIELDELAYPNTKVNWFQSGHSEADLRVPNRGFEEFILKSSPSWAPNTTLNFNL